MADHSSIEWTDATWQIVTGCTVVSPGCTNCYAMRLAGGRLQHHPSRAGLTKPSKAGPVWTGEVRFNKEWLRQPLQWRDPRMIFVAAHGDLFHEGVERHHLDLIFAVMALAPQHTFQVLTKRPERAAKYTNGLLTTSFPVDRIERAMKAISPGSQLKLQWPLPNVWIGTSVEDQVRGAERLSHLRDVRTAVRWVSFEPLLGPVYARNIELPHERFDALAGKRHFSTGEVRDTGRIHWAVIGGESGPGARPMHPDWARQLHDDCAATGTAFFFKQWGAWIDADSWLDHFAQDGVQLLRDGQVWQPPQPLTFEHATWLAEVGGFGFEHRSDGTTTIRVGKRAAGRLLDGVEYNAMPEARP